MADTTTIDEKLKKIDDALDKFETEAGLIQNAPPGEPEELQKYLTMNRDDISKLDDIACLEIGYRIIQYSIYFQRIINKDKARLTWAKSLLASYVTNDSDYDKFRKFEVSVEIVAKTNSAVSRLSSIVRWVQQRIDRLDGISYNLKNLSDMITNIAKAKKAESYEQKRYT